MARELCVVEGCHEPVIAHGLCRNCYDHMRRWSGRSVGEIMNRHKQLNKWQNRMELLTPNQRKR